jgi:hypothetical protein
MPAVLQLNPDSKRFIGRWDDSLSSSMTTQEFNSELRRINVEYSRHFTGGRSWDRITYALPFICIPFGILLIVLSFQEDKWPFLIAGGVVGFSGLIGSVMFRSALGIVLAFCGSVLAVIPYSDGIPWLCIGIGTILCIFGCIGLMSCAIRDREEWRNTRILSILLPVGIIFICVPVGSLKYPTITTIVGGLLILTGILGGIDVLVSQRRKFAKSLEDLQLLISQLNTQYQHKIIWTLLEKSYRIRDREQVIVEILLEENAVLQKDNDQVIDADKYVSLV